MFDKIFDQKPTFEPRLIHFCITCCYADDHSDKPCDYLVVGNSVLTGGPLSFEYCEKHFYEACGDINIAERRALESKFDGAAT